MLIMLQIHKEKKKSIKIKVVC